MRYGDFKVLLLALMGLTLVAGCSLFNRHNEDRPHDVFETLGELTNDLSREKTKGKSPAVAETVRLEAGLLLGDTENRAFDTQSLGSALVELHSNQKYRSLYRMVGLYPEVVVDLLMEANGQNPNWDQLHSIASFFDAQQVHEGGGAWQAWVATRSKVAASEIQTRARFLKLLEENKPTEALRLNLSKSQSNSSVLGQADSLRLEGIAYLMKGENQSSGRKLRQAFRLLLETSPYYASKIGLLLGEAHRHAGNDSAWKDAWKAAVSAHVASARKEAISDPAFWKKAAFLRPVSSQWPKEVIDSMKQKLNSRGLGIQTTKDNGAEAVVWATIGTQSLARHESQNAILAFKKAEALVASKSLKQEFQMQQALAMVDGGQNGPASAILLRLSSGNNLLADRSKAILATMKLQNGSMAQGMNLLQAAIKTSNDWPEVEKLKAHADFGLALLMRGREQQGVQLLRQTFDQFVGLGEDEHAAQCLGNLATYFEAKDNQASYQEYVSRITQFEKSQ